jgi:hypothetical protein
MKDVKDSILVDEGQTGTAAEPVGAVLRTDVSVLGYDIDNWPGMPLVGPATMEEVNVRLDQAEQEMREDKGFSWDQVMMEARMIVNRYESPAY